MRQIIVTIALVFLVGIIGASAQYTDGQTTTQSGVQSSVASTTAALATSTPASGTTASGTTGTAAAGTYSEDYKQGTLLGLRMGFTMQSLVDSALYQQNLTAAEEYNARVNEFNQMISEIFGTEATEEMYLPLLNITDLQQSYAAQQTALASASQGQLQQTATAPNVGTVPVQPYIPVPMNPTNFTYNRPVHMIDGSQRAQAYFTQNGAGRFYNQPEGIKEAFSGKDPDSLGSI